MTNSKERLSKYNFPGWLSDEEGTFLYDAVKMAPTTIAVEIGAWKGRSTSWLLVGCHESSKYLWTVDHFRGSPEHRVMYGPDIDTYDEFCTNMERIERDFAISPYRFVLNVLRMDSWDAAEYFADETVGFLFVDGDHTYESVRQDLKVWWPKVARGGIIALHDSNWEGVARTIQQCRERGYVRGEKNVGSITWWRK